MEHIEERLKIVVLQSGAIELVLMGPIQRAALQTATNRDLYISATWFDPQGEVHSPEWTTHELCDDCCNRLKGIEIETWSVGTFPLLQKYCSLPGSSSLEYFSYRRNILLLDTPSIWNISKTDGWTPMLSHSVDVSLPNKLMNPRSKRKEWINWQNVSLSYLL